MTGTDWFLLDLFNDAPQTVFFAQRGTVLSLRIITKWKENAGEK